MASRRRAYIDSSNVCADGVVASQHCHQPPATSHLERIVCGLVLQIGRRVAGSASGGRKRCGVGQTGVSYSYTVVIPCCAFFAGAKRRLPSVENDTIVRSNGVSFLKLKKSCWLLHQVFAGHFVVMATHSCCSLHQRGRA